MTATGLPLVVVAAAAVVFAGCGGTGDSSSAEEEVKAVTADFIEAVIDERNAEACALTTDPAECLSSAMQAGEWLPEGGFAAIVGENWRDELDAAVVTFLDGDHARIPSGIDNPIATTLVRQGDEWLVVIED